MEGIANFLDDLMGGFELISFSIALGALIWNRFVLEAIVGEGETKQQLIGYSLRWLYISSFALAASHAVELAAKAWVLKETLGQLPVAAYLGTTRFQAGFLRMVLALAMGFYGLRLLKHDQSDRRWLILWGLMAAITLCGAWLTHGVGRFENRQMLMLFTLIHQVAGAMWFGGVVQLIILWRVSRQNADLSKLWPMALRHFSTLGALAVGILLMTGVPLAWSYVDNLSALFGTGYGSLLLTKIVLLAAALLLAGINYRATKRWDQGQPAPELYHAIPHTIEAESFILITLLFVAATLSSQPPAVDIPHLTASPSEVWYMFSPKVPELASPSHEELLIGEARRATIVGKLPPVAASKWSNFNHNVSGLILLAMALTSLYGYFRQAKWTRYWPAGFIVLGIFLFFRSDAQAWPLGPLGFWESTFGDGEILQHRLATLLAFVLGGLEIRARTNPRAENLRYLFPVLCAAGGVLLLTHAHAGFELKTEFLIQSTHTVMGLLAALMAASRWLELKLKPPVSHWAGITSMTSLAMIGLIMIFYDEPIY